MHANSLISSIRERTSVSALLIGSHGLYISQIPLLLSVNMFM